MAVPSKATKTARAGRSTRAQADSSPAGVKPNVSWALYPEEVEAVLRALPELDGQEARLQAHLAQAQALQSLSWRRGTEVFGFITWAKVDPLTAELCCLAVQPQYRRQRVASMLLGYAQSGLQAQGVRMIRARPWAHAGIAGGQTVAAAFLEERGFSPPQDPAPQAEGAPAEAAEWTKAFGS